MKKITLTIIALMMLTSVSAQNTQKNDTLQQSTTVRSSQQSQAKSKRGLPSTPNNGAGITTGILLQHSKNNAKRNVTPICHPGLRSL